MIKILFALGLLLLSRSLSANNEALFEEIFQEHLQLLPYIKEPNSKLIILFSATPGMGKTLIAKKVEEYFHALRLSRDEVREIFAKHSKWSSCYNEKDEKLVNDYFKWLLLKLIKSSPNHFIILDCKCYNRYEEYKQIIHENKYASLLIQIDVERKIVEKRIYLRGKTVDALLQDLDDNWQRYESFNQKHPPDHIFYNGKDPKIPLSLLFEKIHQVLH